MQPSLDELKRWDKAHVWHAFTQMAAYEHTANIWVASAASGAMFT